MLPSSQSFRAAMANSNLIYPSEAHEIRTIRNQFGPRGPPIDRRRAPGGQLVALGFPNRASRLPVERFQERAFLLVALDDDLVPIKDRRTGRAPLVLGKVVGAHVELSQIALPQQLSDHIVRIQPLRTEEGDQHLAIGGWRGIGVSGLHVALLFWHPLVGRAVPQDLAALAVEADQLPLLRADVV